MRRNSDIIHQLQYHLKMTNVYGMGASLYHIIDPRRAEIYFNESRYHDAQYHELRKLLYR
jgi:hypothetical protein